jgi:hypothetical protein
MLRLNHQTDCADERVGRCLDDRIGDIAAVLPDIAVTPDPVDGSARRIRVRDAQRLSRVALDFGRIAQSERPEHEALRLELRLIFHSGSLERIRRLCQQRV